MHSKNSYNNGIHQIEEFLLPLFYFDVFSYPLDIEEMIKFSSSVNHSKDKLNSTIQLLTESKMLVKIEEYYMLDKNEDWIVRRNQDNKRAQKILPRAKFMSSLISKFPFVRSVFISGSLSKHVMPEEGDVDYFIITKPGRLWITRTLLILFKKIFLLNSKKYFCINYFIDEDHLEIEEKNLFTATEITTILPSYGSQYYKRFMDSNQWIKKYYPNNPLRIVDDVPLSKRNLPQRITELFFYGRFGSWVDKVFMNMTLNLWKRKFDTFDTKKFDLTLKTRKYVSKHHPQDFQSKILKAYNDRICLFEKKHKLQFNSSENEYSTKV